MYLLASNGTLISEMGSKHELDLSTKVTTSGPLHTRLLYINVFKISSGFNLRLGFYFIFNFNFSAMFF